MQDSCKNRNVEQVCILRDGVDLFIFTMRFLHWAFRPSADLMFLFFIEVWLIYSVKVCNKGTHLHTHTHTHTHVRAFQVALVVKNPPATAVDTRDLIPGLGRSPGVGNSNPLQYSRLENSVDRGA